MQLKHENFYYVQKIIFTFGGIWTQENSIIRDQRIYQ